MTSKEVINHNSQNIQLRPDITTQQVTTKQADKKTHSKAGAPSTYTLERAEAICRDIADGKSLKAAGTL